MTHSTNIKLIVTDLDGTLLDGDEKVPSRFFEHIKELTALGIKIVIASGRQYYNIKNLFGDIAEDLYFVGDNGALGFHKDENFHASYMPWETAFELVKQGKEMPDVIPLISATHNTFFEKGNEEEVAFIRQFYKQCITVDRFSDIKTNDEEPLKVAYYDMTGVKKNSLLKFKNDVPNIVATQSNVHWLDLAPSKTNKGEAVKALQEKYQISPEETMAFGDYHNDIEMLQRAKYSFAVASAQDDVKEICDYITDSNKDLGVINILNQLINSINKKESITFERFLK